MVDQDTQGVMVAVGGNTSGFVFYIKDQQVVFDYNFLSSHFRAVSQKGAAIGKSKLGVLFERVDNGGIATLLFDDQPEATVEIPRILRVISSAGMDVGRDALSQVCNDYQGPFPFNRKIHRLIFDVPKRESTQAEQQRIEALAKMELERE